MSSDAGNATPWIAFGQGSAETSACRLFCFPCAGAGATLYRPWIEGLAPDIDVCPVQLPGREERRGDAAILDMDELVCRLADGLEAAMTPPFAFFGHSMGGLIAFELARELRRRGELLPSHLLIAASPAPQLPLGREPLHPLSDDALVAHLREMGGTPEKLFEMAWLLQSYLPVLRADLTLYETRGYEAESPLTVPITVVGGNRDPFVSAECLEAWSTQTIVGFKRHELRGEHFFLKEAREPLLACVQQALC